MKDKEKQIEEMKNNARIHIGAVVEKLRMDGCELWEIDGIVSDILNYITIPEDSVVLSREEYNALIAEYKAITYKYDDICDRYRLCKDANETIKQHTVMTREVAITIKTQSVNDYNFDDKVIEEPILLEKLKEIATREGVEIKE